MCEKKCQKNISCNSSSSWQEWKAAAEPYPPPLRDGSLMSISRPTDAARQLLLLLTNFELSFFSQHFWNSEHVCQSVCQPVILSVCVYVCAWESLKIHRKAEWYICTYSSGTLKTEILQMRFWKSNIGRCVSQLGFSQYWAQHPGLSQFT